MRMNIDIDDRLLRLAMQISGANTKKAAVEVGLKLLIEMHAQSAICNYRGKVQSEGDLDQSRLNRV